MTSLSIGSAAGAPPAARGTGSARPGDGPSADDIREFESLVRERERHPDVDPLHDGGRGDGREPADACGFDTGGETARARGGAMAGAAARFRSEPVDGCAPAAPPPFALAIPTPVSVDPPRTDADALVALLERHVAELAVSTTGTASPEVCLKLDAAVLPGAVLTLVKTDAGWTLRTGGSTADARRALASHASGLRARFSAGALGALHIEGLDDDGEDPA